MTLNCTKFQSTLKHFCISLNIEIAAEKKIATENQKRYSIDESITEIKINFQSVTTKTIQAYKSQTIISTKQMKLSR